MAFFVDIICEDKAMDGTYFQMDLEIGAFYISFRDIKKHEDAHGFGEEIVC